MDTTQPSTDWQPYDGTSEARYYDVETKRGETFLRCWPLDGHFIGPRNMTIMAIDVARVRLSSAGNHA